MPMQFDGLGAKLVCDDPPVVRVTAPNPGPKTLEGTHCYVVGGAEGCYAIDPGPDIEAYQSALFAFIQHTSRRALGILLTHGHPDHAPGSTRLAELLGVPIRASPALDSQYFIEPPSFSPLEAGERLAVDGDVIRVVPAPGHSGDHIAFWLEDARILFAGDTILGRGTSSIAPPEGNMAQYMRTLERLRALDARLIAPGHGPIVTEPAAKFEEYVIHRRQREAEIVRALQRRPETVDALVKQIYARIDPGLLDLAAGSVLAQLQKLEEEGRVRMDGDMYHLISWS